MIWLRIMDWLIEPVQHSVLAFLLGCLAFYLILTIFGQLVRVLGYSTLYEVPSGLAISIVIFSLLLAISIALASHFFFDQLYSWYTTPLDPPLELDVPEHLINPKDWSTP